MRGGSSLEKLRLLTCLLKIITQLLTKCMKLTTIWWVCLLADIPARIHSLGPSTEKPDDLDSAGLSQCVLRSFFQASLQRNCFILKQSIFFFLVSLKSIWNPKCMLLDSVLLFILTNYKNHIHKEIFFTIEAI